MTKQYTIEFKRTHSSEFAERAGMAPDQFMAIVHAPEFRDDGSSWPKAHFIVEAKTRATVKRAAEKFIASAVAQ